MNSKHYPLAKAVVAFFALCLAVSCKPIQNLKQPPAAYTGKSTLQSKTPVHEPSKKTVVIIADSKMTEVFDMLAPFYLFNATEKANVYIVAKDHTPIRVKNELYILPQLTFAQANALNIAPDVIIIPALSIRDEHQDTTIIHWIKNHFGVNTKMLAVCDGASTAAATGLYDGKSITCHASDYEGLKAHFPKPIWIQDVSVTKSGNLFSTAGVSNAVEGSLTIINELFGKETMQAVAENIHYPHAEIKTAHESIAIDFNSKLVIAKKVMFRRNKKIALLLEEGTNEFYLASILDTYSRTFPHSLNMLTVKDSTLKSKYGLTIVCTDKADIKALDEIHMLSPGVFAKLDAGFARHTQLISYNELNAQYPIEVCLKRISGMYGYKFENVVKQLLDYN